MAEMLVALGDDRRAAEFSAKATALRNRWHDAFWMPEEQFYAMALGPDKQQVRSIASNPGHALAAGLVPVQYARACADRLMADDLFSGWGVRTLSHQHPSYNPLAYHLGTVWPVENATFALGFKRYGLDDHLDRLATAMCDAAAYFGNSRLPEAMGGLGRRESPVPSVYPKSNSPQAWSASAMVQLVQTLLGIYPFAPARVNVIDKDGVLFVVEAPPPQDVNPHAQTFAEAAKMWLLEHAPGRLTTALRLALGEDVQIGA